MEGLPLKTRQRFFFAFVVIFIVVVPLLVLYASGYRISEDWKLIKTGGIYIDVPLSGVSFFLNDEYSGEGSLFQKSFFIQNLLPGTYSVSIKREGYHEWKKDLPVYPQIISNGKALLLPTDVNVLLLRQSATASSRARTQTTLPESQHRLIDAAFAATSTGVSALPLGATTTIQFNSATTTVKEQGDIGIWKDENGLHGWWLGSEDRFPYFFCELGECERKVLISTDVHSIGHFDFYPDDNQFVIIEWPDGIFVTELDTRPPQNIQPLYPTPGAQFRVLDGEIYILDKGNLFQVVL